MDGSACEVPAGADLRETNRGGLELCAGKTCVAVCPHGSYYLDTCHHPLEKAATPADIEAGLEHLRSFDWPAFNDEDYDDLRAKAQRLRQESDRFIVGNLWVHVFAAGQILRGFENFMMDLLADKRLAHALMGRLVDGYEERVAKYVAAVGETCDIIQVNDDLGTQKGLQLSLPTYREMIKPYHARLWQQIKQLSGKPLLLHSCGSIHDVIPDLIEMGVDAINPVQVAAANMDSAQLKAEFGRDLTFWGGGCDTQAVLERGTPAEVRDEVRRRCEDFAPGGGFVFCQVHNIQPTVTPENVMAMYEALKELGG
jgi:uroporphyrinogen decarboxylase